MHRFAVVCCAALLVGPTAAAFAADLAFDLTGKAAPAKSALEKRGLTEFDTDGDGKLDAKERAAVIASRRASAAADRKTAVATATAQSAYIAENFQFGPLIATPGGMMGFNGHRHYGFRPLREMGFTQKVFCPAKFTDLRTIQY